MIKKNIIFILIIMSILYIPSLTTQAKYEDTLLDYPIDELNGLTLNQVFEDNNQAYGEFLFNIENVVSGENMNIIQKKIDVTQNNKFYIRIKFDTNSIINVNIIRAYNGSIYFNGTILTNTINIQDNELSTLFDTINTDRINIYFRNSVTGSNYYPLEAYYIDFGILGLNNLTKEEMDYYYNVYQSYNEIDNLDLNEEYSGYMETIWNTFTNFVKGTDKIITFATEPISFSIPKIDHDDEGDIVEKAIVDAVNWIIGGLNTFGLKNYTVLEIIITGWIVLLPMYLIKKFIPLL